MRHSKLLAAFATVLLGAARASAISYVPVADRDLADQATVVARVTVRAIEAGPANLPPATDYVVEVSELVQGYLPGGTVVVRVPGGVRADGLGFDIAGAPKLSSGEQALLFLEPRTDGTYGILHLMLGAFHLRREGKVELAEQDLAGAHRAAADGTSDEGDRSLRELGRFTAWLADRAAGVERAADYWVKRPADVANVAAKTYTALATTDNVPARWFGFESGSSAAWRVHSSGQPGVALSQTVASFQSALDVWASDPTSVIGYTYAGTTTAAGGLGSPDATNAVLFDDPYGQVPGTFDCKKGGVVAIGGSYFWATSGSYHGQAYHEIAEADVVTNDGASCFFANNPQGAAEVFAHELGHTLGFGHATDPQAAMYAMTHNDGRGARLDDDDRTGASMVYGDGSYQPAPKPVAAGPFTVAATASRTAVELSWTSPFTGLTGFRVESQKKKGVFQVVVTVPPGEAGVILSGLKPNQTLSLRVTAVGTDGAVAGSSNLIKVRTLK